MSTKGQSDNSNWIMERKKRLTSSNIGEIISRSVNNDSVNIINRLLYSKFGGNVSTRKDLKI